MKEFDGHKDWTSQYHPTGQLNQGKDGPLAKWGLTIVRGSVFFITFLFGAGLLWTIFFNVWFNWVDSALYACAITTLVAGCFWDSTLLSNRPRNKLWNRVSKIVFGCGLITFLVMVGLTISAGNLIQSGVVPQVDRPPHDAPCLPDCSWWHQFWDY